MDVERRYRLDEERPATLGVIWVFNSKLVVGSGILVEYGKDPSFPVQNYADFCFGDDATGNPIIVRFWVSSVDDVTVGWLSSTGTDLLPFGNSVEANNLITNIRTESVDWVLGRFVIGRQYVFDLGMNFSCEEFHENGNGVPIDCPFGNRSVYQYLSGQTDSPPEQPGMIDSWYGMPGHI